MAANLRPYLTITGYFGTPALLGVTRGFAANTALNAARGRSGGVPGLVVVGEKPVDALKAGLQGSVQRTNASAQTDETRRAPVALSRRAVYAAAQSAKTAWSATTIASAGDWEQLKNPFGGDVQGLFYMKATKDARALFSGPQVASNAPFALKLFYFKGDYKDSKQIGFVHWGAQSGSSLPQWRLQFFDGQFSLQRLSPSWTQGAQTALESLLVLPSPTDAQEANIAVQRQTLYQSETALSVSGDSFAKMVEVWVEADETGAVWLNFNKEGEQVVELADVIATRKTAPIWNAGPMQIGCNQGAFMWQRGSVTANRKSRFYLPSVHRSDDTNGTASALYYAPQGTAVTCGIDQTSSLDKPYVELTSDGTRTPVLHDVFYLAPATARTPDNEVVFDSEDHLLSGSVPIASLGINWGGEMRRMALDVEILTPEGAVDVSGGVRQEFFAERIASFALGNGTGTTTICKGLVQSPTLTGATNAAQGVTLAAVSGGQTALKFRLVDFWQIADEWLLLELPIGDDKFLGDYLKLLLGFAGFTAAEVYNVAPSLFGNGPRLPKAAAGEKPLIQPTYEQSLGDFLRKLMADYASGYNLDCYTGVWRLRERGYNARCAFSTSEHDTSGLPTFPILDGLDLIRDHKDVRTSFCGQGADQTPGSAPVEWNVGQLVNASSHNFIRGYQGRIRRAATEQNDAWRTREETLRGTRAKVRREARPGRFFGFRTSFCLHLLGADLLAPGDRCFVSGKTISGEALDGVLCEIISLSGGSIERGNDSLSVVAQEVLNYA